MTQEGSSDELKPLRVVGLSGWEQIGCSVSLLIWQMLHAVDESVKLTLVSAMFRVACMGAFSVISGAGATRLPPSAAMAVACIADVAVVVAVGSIVVVRAPPNI